MATYCPDWDSLGECQWVTVSSVRAADPGPLSVNQLASGLKGSDRRGPEYSQGSQVQFLLPLPVNSRSEALFDPEEGLSP